MESIPSLAGFGASAGMAPNSTEAALLQHPGFPKTPPQAAHVAAHPVTGRKANFSARRGARQHSSDPFVASSETDAGNNTSLSPTHDFQLGGMTLKQFHDLQHRKRKDMLKATDAVRIQTCSEARRALIRPDGSCSGALDKKGGWLKGEWQSRWFYLEGATLSWSKRVEDAAWGVYKYKGSATLESVVQSDAQLLVEATHAMKGKVSYCLRAANSYEAMIWREQMELGLGKAPAPAGGDGA